MEKSISGSSLFSSPSAKQEEICHSENDELSCDNADIDVDYQEANYSFLVEQAKNLYIKLTDGAKDVRIPYQDIVRAVRDVQLGYHKGIVTQLNKDCVISFNGHYVMVTLWGGATAVSGFVNLIFHKHNQALIFINHINGVNPPGFGITNLGESTRLLLTDKEIVMEVTVVVSNYHLECKIDGDFLGFYYHNPRLY